MATTKNKKVASRAYERKKPVRKRAQSRRRRRPDPFISPEWQRACDDVTAAFAAQEVKAYVTPFGGAPAKSTSVVVKRAAARAEATRLAVIEDLPEAMREYDAAHPPCQPGPYCMHDALLDVAAHNAFEDGHFRNPIVAFRVLRGILQKYIRSRS